MAVIFLQLVLLVGILGRIIIASGAPWVQTDWSSGVGSSTVNQFISSTNVNYSTNGEIHLNTTSGWSSSYLSWARRKPITVTNVETEQINYQVRLSITYDSDMKANFDDIRFTNSQGTPLDYWLQSKTDSTSAIVWVEIDTLLGSSNTTIFIYYSNSGASSESNGVNTFSFFDDFNAASLDLAKWTRVDPRNHMTQSGGKLLLYNGSGSGNWDSTIHSNQSFARNSWSFEFDMRWTSDYSPYDAIMWGWKDSGAGISYTNLIYGHYNQGDGFCTVNCPSIFYESGAGTASYGSWSNNTNYVIRERMKPTSGNYYEKSIDGGNNWITDYSSPTSNVTDLKPAWMLYAGDYEVDNARVRKWLTTEPTSSFGTEVNLYLSSGSITSNIYDTSTFQDWGNLVYSANSPAGTSVSIKIRAGNQLDLSDSSNFTSCSAIANNTDISGGCTVDRKRYVQYEVTLTSNGTISPTFNEITINFSSSDTVPPSSNADSIVMYRSNGGTVIPSESWTNNLSPKYSWNSGVDETDIKGYCLRLVNRASLAPDFDDQDEIDLTSIAFNSSGLIDASNSPVSTSGTNCNFIINSTEIDFTNQGYRLSPWLTTSDDLYYLFIKVIDVGYNLYQGPATFFKFKVDITLPTNVAYISSASGTFGNANDMNFSWPVNGGGTSSSDANSTLLGWQYQINSTSGEWQGTDNSAFLGIKYIPSNFSDFPYFLNSTIDGANIQIGNNVIYFRTIDKAGNASSTSTLRTASISFGGNAPKFSLTCDNPEGITITPTISDSNSFSFNWPEAEPAPDRSISHYYYMINTEPPTTLATITSNSAKYFRSDTNSVETQSLTGVVKGTNRIYVIAVDDIDIYSSTNCLQGVFTLDSNLPDPPTSLNASDASIKSGKLWRASLAWGEPQYKGTGMLSYLIERSEDGINWTNISTTSGNAYLDTVNESKRYYWRVATIDNSVESEANPSYSNAVFVIPKGSYTEPPTLTSQPVELDVSTKKAKIAWTTSRESDSKIAYGTKSGEYFTEEVYNSEKETNHLISLTNLTPSTLYYYVAKWTDEDGNTGISKELNFNTSEAPRVKDVSVNNISISSALIKYTSKGASSIKIYFGKSTDFGGVREIPNSPIEASYTSQLTGLEDGSKYYYKINSLDQDGNEYQGTVLDFTTLPSPRLYDVSFSQIKGTAQPSVLVTWNSNTEVSTVISFYESSNSNNVKDESNPNLIKGLNRAFLRGLQPETNYSMLIKARDKVGNEVVSDIYQFTTAIDTRPPTISGLKIESVIQTNSGQGTSAQIIISWNTDKPSTSQVEFGEGTNGNYSQKTQEETNLKQNHLVVISDLTPSKVYSIRAISRDKAGNIGKSGGNNTLTPKAVDSALDIVITILSDAFGFLSNISK